MRRVYLDAWRKFSEGLAIQPLELQLAQIVAEHPEYHTLLEHDDTLERDFHGQDGAQNPFLHMSMHMAIREQVSTDRPPGVAAIHARLAGATGGAHAAEHIMMKCLGDALALAQRDNSAPDERRYVDCLRSLHQA